MPRVSPDEVTRLASLARIELAEGEAERLSGELGSILEHVATLEGAAAGTGGHAAHDRTVFRDDEPGERLGKTAAQAAFPDKEKTFLKVPRVF